MPHVNCCIPFCSADSKRHARIRFFSLPKEETRRAIWVALIRNSNLRIDSRYTSVCSLHFINGKKANDKKDPSFFPWSQEWPAIINNYNKMRAQLGLDNMSPEQLRKNRPMTLRIPPMCPWANRYINLAPQKSLNKLFSQKILQCDFDFEDITDDPTSHDFLDEIESDCQIIKEEPPSREILPSFENKTEISSSISNKLSFDINDNLSQLILPTDLQSHMNSENSNPHFNLPDITNYFTQLTSSINDCVQSQPTTVYSQSHTYNNTQSRLSHMFVDAHQNMEIQNQIQRRNKSSFYGEQNTPATFMKTVENPTHSYVVHKHQGHMLSNMTNLWKKGKLCDASIGNGTMKIMVHKVVLIALSPQLLTLPNANVTTGCFQLTFSQDIGGDALWAFAKYMYEGVVSLNEEVLVDMEHIAKILALTDLSDMCKLYRKQVLSSVTSSVTTKALNSPSIEPPSIMRDAISTDIVNSLPKTDGPSLSTGVSFMGLPDQDITPTISKSVQQLQKIATESMTNPIQFQTNESVVPVNLYSADQDSSVSSYAEDSVRLKHEPTSPLKKRCNKKGFLPSFPSRNSDPHIVVHDDLSEPWQPQTYCDNEDLQSPPPPKRLKSSELQEDSLSNLSHSNTEDFSPHSTKDSYPVKIELDQDNSDLEVSEIPYVVSLIENKGLDTT
ncbi:uncharacterized protein LOC115230799 isoform X2 [Argonauta hians]